MPAAAVFIGAVSGFITTVAAVVAPIITTVVSIVTPVVSAIVSIVGTVVATISPVVGGIVDVIGGVVEVISAGVKASVAAIKTTVLEPLGNIIKGLKTAIGEIATTITEPLKPILTPIKDTLVTIKDFVVDTQTWIQAELAPVAELVEIVNTVSAIMFVNQLLKGTVGISQIVGEVERDSGIVTAQAITTLYNDIVNVAVGTASLVHEQTLSMANAIDDYDAKFREDNKIALAMLKEGMEEQVTQVANNLTLRLTPIEGNVTMIARRTEDLPYFQDMLIKALS